MGRYTSPSLWYNVLESPPSTLLPDHQQIAKVGILYTYRGILLDEPFLIGEIDITRVLLFGIYPTVSYCDTFEIDLVRRRGIDDSAC